MLFSWPLAIEMASGFISCAKAMKITTAAIEKMMKNRFMLTILAET
jgi:hypothetical protein